MVPRRTAQYDERESRGTSSRAPETVRVELLGGFRVSVGSHALDAGRWRHGKAASLVKLLALAPGHRLHRERAMDLLWPGSDAEAAANSLRQALYLARRALKPMSDTTPSGYLQRR